jgi:hypothetical protein
MTTQTKVESEPHRSNANHGQFYRSTELVAGVHRAEGGIFEGFRAAHAFGRIYAGTFTATAVAKTFSRASHFQSTPMPVTARLSGASGDPENEEERELLAAKLVGRWRSGAPLN